MSLVYLYFGQLTVKAFARRVVTYILLKLLPISLYALIVVLLGIIQAPVVLASSWC